MYLGEGGPGLPVGSRASGFDCPNSVRDCGVKGQGLGWPPSARVQIRGSGLVTGDDVGTGGTAG